MIRLLGWGLGLVAALGLSFVATAARAQSDNEPENGDDRGAERERYRGEHVSIGASKGSFQMEVAPQGGFPAVVQCENYCDFWALPGRYTLYTRNNDTGERRQLSLRIKQSSRYVFDSGDDSTRSLGLGLGVSGIVALSVGFFTTVFAVLDAQCSDDSDAPCGHQQADVDFALAGLGLMAAGAALTPVGWTIYAHNGSHLTPLDAPYAAKDPGPSVKVGVIGVPGGGLGLGGIAAF